MRCCEGSGRARVPCACGAQPPACAPRWVLLSFISCSDARGFCYPSSRLLARGFPEPPPASAARGWRIPLPLPSSFVLLRSIRSHHPSCVTSSPVSHSKHFRPFGAVALVGLLRRVRPARRGARPLRGLSLRSAQRCRSAGFFSATALSSAQGVRGFPLSRRLARFTPLPPCSNARRQATFFVSPGGRGVHGSCSGLTPLRLSRGAHRPPPCTPGRPDAGGGVFHGILFPPELQFSMIFRSITAKKS